MNISEYTQRLITLPTFMYQRSFERLFCVFADNQNVYAVSVYIIDFGMCIPGVSGIFLMTAIEPLSVIFPSLL